MLSVFPCDRALPGLARAFDLKRICRRLARSPRYVELSPRHRRSSALLMRYKPERRAVVRLDIFARDSHDAGVQDRLALRVLPPAHASRALRARRTSGVENTELVPTLVEHDERRGLLFEEWLDIEVNPHDGFGVSADAGAALARVHALPCGNSLVAAHAGPSRDTLALFEVDRNLWTAARRILVNSDQKPRRATWIHGDFHPDQIAQEVVTQRLRVLDWDGLAIGDPVLDIASWIADALATGVGGHVEAEFVKAYEANGGAIPASDDLDRGVSVALCLRAAAALRRLEADAVAKAAVLLDLASRRGSA